MSNMQQNNFTKIHDMTTSSFQVTRNMNRNARRPKKVSSLTFLIFAITSVHFRLIMERDLVVTLVDEKDGILLRVYDLEPKYLDSGSLYK